MNRVTVKDLTDSRILVVDDNVENLSFLGRLLGKRGCHVDKATNGMDALEMAASYPPDLILLDIQMPGIDGFEVCKRLKEDNKLSFIPVIFLSGLNDLDAKMRAFRCGGVDFLSKPFDLEEILIRVQTHLRIVRVEHLKREIEVRKAAEAEVRRLNDELEVRVRQRTQELITVNDQLRKFHRSIEHSPVSVVITDRKGTIEYVNPKFTEATGYTVEDVMGKNPRMLNARKQPPEFYRNLWKTIEAGDIWQGEFCNKKKTGELYWESAAISPIRNDQGEITHYVAVKEDITGRKRTAEEMSKARETAEIANKAKSVFLANMSHEIRTPLNAILGYTQILQGDSVLTASQKKTLGIISRSGEHLLALINDILEMSKIEAGQKTLQPKTFDVHALLQDIEAMFQVRTNAKGITLDVLVGEDVPRIICADEGKIRQVVINLLGNAVKFTDRGGMIVRMNTFKKDAQGQQLQIEVQDTGTGIPEHELSRIFNPFEQATSTTISREGTGLGLTISREFVKLMGGELSVQSQLGKGSTFTFVIPVEPVETPNFRIQRKEKRVLRLAPSQEPWRILVVDDLDLNRTMLTRILTRVGVTVKEASNGAVAVELFRSWNPDLILMDLQMPVMDGYQAMKTIRSLDAGAILIPVTACGFEDELQAAIEAGANGFIRKPFKEAELIETIATHLKTTCLFENEINSKHTTPAKHSNIPSLENPMLLPAPWIASMQEAMLNGDIFAIGELIGTIKTDFPNISEHIRQLAEKYDYEKISQLLKQ